MAEFFADLRLTPQVPPARFVGWQAGCHIQYYDDTEGKDPSKALSSRTFDVNVARYKQRQLCAVTFSLQAFGRSRTRNDLLCFRNMGIDVDLVSANERYTLTVEQIDARKQNYLTNCLAPFALAHHWLIETRHGFHIIFRIQPLRQQMLIREAAELNRRLVRKLRGDENAVLLTQVFRVPGTLQFKGKPPPFRCRLLLDNGATIQPYELGTIRAALAACENTQNRQAATPTQTATPATKGVRSSRWREGLTGVQQGQRNATATSLAGAILRRLPEELWELAGWGGLQEWNTRNSVPLPTAELRAVFESIARREQLARQRRQPDSASSRPCDPPSVRGTP